MKLHFSKGILFTLALLSSPISHAITVTKENCLYCDRFYIGATAGMVSLFDRESTNSPTRNAHYLSAAGPMLGGIFGFDFCLYDQVRLDLEGFVNVPSIDISDNQDYPPQTTYNVKMRYSLGLRALPTYEFSPQTAGHLIVGYSYGKFKIHDNGNYGVVSSMFGQSGLQLGLGIETFLSKWVLIRGDLIYTGYPGQSTDGVTTTSPPLTQVYQNNLSTLEADLSLVYKLGQI